MPPRVFLLKPGSILRDASGQILDARSSVTLILSEKRKIVVDSGLDGEQDVITHALDRFRLQPRDIDTVLNTHSHHDHCANNQLFSRAEILRVAEGEDIAPGIKATGTPGHTMDSVSVVVEGARTVVIAGDALPTFSNFQKNLPPFFHVDRELAVMSLRKIIEMADVIVPGHDLPFSVRERRIISDWKTSEL